jgi:hypothetical protein
MTDNSDVTPTSESITLGDSVGGAPGSAGLASEVYLCMTSDGGQVIYNGLLSAEPAGILVSGAYGLPSPSQTDFYTVEFFAGQIDTLCGNILPYKIGPGVATPETIAPVAGLDNSSENGVITPYITMENEA